MISGEYNLFFAVWAVRKIISRRLVGKIIIITLSFRVCISKNKNIDDRVKKTYAMILAQVIYEIDHISLLP